MNQSLGCSLLHVLGSWDEIVVFQVLGKIEEEKKEWC